MMRQSAAFAATIGLFEQAPAQEHSATSVVAARRIQRHVGRLEQLVLDALRRAGADGQTDPENQAETGLSGDSQRPRRVGLVKAGQVVPAGFKRRTPSGREAQVWVLAEYAEGAS